MKKSESESDKVPELTGHRETDVNGDVWFEVVGEEKLMPQHPDVVYTRTGEWRGWCHWLGSDDVAKVCEGMTDKERAIEEAHVSYNKSHKE